MDTIEEKWKDLVGWETYYEVSSLGRWRSKTRVVTDGRTIRGKMLKPWFKDGYRIASLPNGKKIGLHRLICETFHGPAPEGKPWALHRNGVRDDNRPENLYWGDQVDNVADALRHGTHARTQSLKTHCKQGHPYDDENTYTPPGTTYRQCRICRANADIRHKLKKKGEDGTLDT
jgi:hypothetical protein